MVSILDKNNKNDCSMVYNLMKENLLFHGSIDKSFDEYNKRLGEDGIKIKLTSDISNALKIYIIKIKNNIIGFASIKKETENNIVIHKIYIRDNCRGNGYGKNLINNIIKDYHNNNIKLSVLTKNINAINFYKSLGFKDENIINERGISTISMVFDNNKRLYKRYGFGDVQ